MSRDDNRFWDLYALSYDAIGASIPYRAHIDALLDALSLPGAERVLDLGCGTGNLERRLGARGADCLVVGVDRSPAMLRRARRKCEAYGNLTFLQADLAERLPFPDASFDRVVANNALYAMADKAALIAEAGRVLRPGGLLVVSDPKPGARVSRVVAAHFEALSELALPARAAAAAGSLARLLFGGLIPMALSGLVIGGRLRGGEYAFTSAEELTALFGGLESVRLTEAYAGQSWLAVGVKGGAGVSSGYPAGA